MALKEEVRSQFCIPATVYDWLKEKAKRDHRSINGQLNAVLQESMKRAQGEAA